MNSLIPVGKPEVTTSVMNHTIKLGVISDTHLREPDERLKRCAEENFRGVDAIVHCGDMVKTEVIRYLEGFAPVYAVHGNMDEPDTAREFPEQRILEIGDVKIGVIHGWGAPWGLEKRVCRKFEEEGVDAVFFGHSHVPHKSIVNGIFVFNPGAFAKGWFTRTPSIGIVTIRGKKFEAKHVEVNY